MHKNTWVVTANSLNILVAGGTPSNTIHAAATVDKEAAASLFDKRAQFLRLNAGTAANCVGYVKWACVSFNLSLTLGKCYSKMTG